MERTLCIWYPAWAVRPPVSPPGEPAQAVGDGNRVVAVNDAAEKAGIVVGMRRREAEAVCPAVCTVIADPGAEMAAFEAVVTAVEDLIPRLEVVDPGMLLAPVGGALRFYGSEAALVDRVVGTLDSLTGPGYRLGLAAGPFAARIAARQATAVDPVSVITDDVAFLRTRDVATLGKEDLAASLRWLGITTLGELAGLPRDALVSRFGTTGLEAHRLASGEDRAAHPREVPADLAVEERFSPPLHNLEQAAFVARSLAHRLLADPALRGAAPHRVEVEAEAAGGARRVRTWRNADPFDEATLAERVRWQLAAWLDEARFHSGPGIHGGLLRLRLAPADISDEGRQLALHEDARGMAEANRTLVQAQHLVGPDRVLQAHPRGGRDPADRIAWRRWGEDPSPERSEAPWPGSVPAPTPSLVPDDPPLLEVEWEDGMPVRVRLGSRWVPVLSWAGPWRRMGRWWQGEPPADRYQIVTSAGALLCETRHGRTYLTGLYD